MRDGTSRATRYGLGLLLGLTLLRGLIYSVLIPPWQAPDETGHFEYAWHIAQLGRLPSQEDISPKFEQELLASLYEWEYGELIGRPLPEAMPAQMKDLPKRIFARQSRTLQGERFSLAYLWQALFLLPFRSQDLPFQLFMARFSTILLNMGIVCIAFLTFSRLVLVRSHLVLAMTALVVFLPQHTFINSVVGDGPLAELMVCLVIYCWVLIFQRGATVWTVGGILLGMVAAIWSKTTALFLLPLNAGLALWWFFRQPRQARSWRWMAYLAVGAGLLGLAFWAWMHYQSPLGSRTLPGVLESMFKSDLIWVDQRGITFGQALLYAHNSFWASFGWMAVPASLGWYLLLMALVVAAVAGWLIRGRTQNEFQPFALFMMTGAVLAALLIFLWRALLTSSSGYFQFQGRYLFPIVVPLAFLLVGGWVLTSPGRRRGLLAWPGVFLLTVFDLWSMVQYIIPFFYFR